MQQTVWQNAFIKTLYLKLKTLKHSFSVLPLHGLY